MKHRLDRVKEVLKRELSEMVNRELTFPGALVTIQHVDITPDLKHAHVFVSAIGDAKAKAEVIPLLVTSRIQLQSLLSRRVVLKYTPQLHFKMDDSIERGDRVIELLGEIEVPETENND